MTDLASLGLRVESTEVETGNRRLDDLSVKAGKAERATDGLAGGSKRAATATEQLARSTNDAISGLAAMAGALTNIDRRTETLRASIDPLYAAQKRLDAELQEAASLYRLGAIGADEYAKSVEILTARQASATKAQMAMNALHTKGGKAAGLQAYEVANLGRQFADVGVTAAMGMSPLMILIQQGPQIADVFATASARGIGFKAVLGEIAGMAAPFAPLIIALGTVAGIMGGGLLVATQQINKEHKDLAKSLGLTAEQLKKVKNDGVTMGDTLKAVFQVSGKALLDAFGINIKDVGKALGDFYQGAVDGVMFFAKTTVATVGGAFGAIKAIWGQIPAAIGDVMITAANAAIGATEKMVNKIIELVNQLFAKVNGAAKLVGLDLVLPPLDTVKLAKLTNQYEGAARGIVGAAAKGAKDGAKEAVAGFEGFLAAIEAQAVKNATARILKEAGDAKAKKTASEAESDYARALRQAAEALVALKAETAQREKLNALVASGAMSMAEANHRMEVESSLRPLIAEAAKVEGAQKAALLAIIDRLREAKERLYKVEQDTANLGAIKAQRQTLEYLQAENNLVGAGNVQRSIELAQLREKQNIIAAGGDPNTATSKARIGGAGDIAGAQAALAVRQDSYNRSLSETYDKLVQIDGLVNSSANGLATAFDGMDASAKRVVSTIGKLASAYTSFGVKEAAINRTREASAKRVVDALDTGNIKAISEALQDNAKVAKTTARDMADAQVGAYGDMAGAAKGFFEEGSSGYKVLQAAEIAFRAIQFALSVRAMAQDAAETGQHLLSAGAKAVASTIAGVAKAFEQMGVYGFIGAGAILAFMGAMGVNAGSGGSKGVNAADIQKAQGAGSVLGDATAKSNSIANSLEIVAANSNKTLEYSNGMLKALRAIEGSIDVVAAAIARALGVGGALAAPDGLGQKSASNLAASIFAPGGFDPGGLFSATTTKKLADAGIKFAGQTLAEILSGGIDAAFYQTIETRTKKKAFGFTYSDKLSNKTTTTAIDEDLSRQLSLIVGSLRDGVLAAADTLGVQGAGAVLDAFAINLGNLSFKDMKADEISAALQAVFSKLGDDMAAAVIPGLTSLQKVGEGLFETLMRVARQYQVVDVTLSAIGMTFGAVGLSSLAARERLVDLFGSLDAFTEQVSFYSDNFLTDAEKLAPIQASLTKELTRLGISGLDTRDEFKALVQSLDLSTAAGAEMFASLMAIAPAFAAVTEETKAITDARDQLSAAYERESGALADTRDRFKAFASDLRTFRDSLYRGPAAALSPEAQYNANKAEFERVAALAAQGNEQALGDLQGVSQAYLDASKAYYASSAGYFTDLTAVRDAVTAAEASATSQVDVATQQLIQLENMVSGFIDLNTNVISVHDAIENLTALLGSPTPVVVTGAGGTTTSAANDNGQVVSELQQMNETLQAGLTQQAAMSEQSRQLMQEQIDLLNRQIRELQQSA